MSYGSPASAHARDAATDGPARHYVVTWCIDVDAATPRDAAAAALEMLRDPASTALVFDVHDHNRPDDAPVTVDLDDPVTDGPVSEHDECTDDCGCPDVCADCGSTEGTGCCWTTDERDDDSRR